MEFIKKNDNTWIIEDSGVRCFVLEGKDKTALIDTGMNIENIKEVLSSLTDKEVILLNTHADRDHIGGNSCFDVVHIGVHEMAFYSQSGLNNKLEALFDGKLTVDQVVEQESSGYQDEDLDIDGIHRGILERALEKLKEGKDRSEIIEETVDALELL